LKCRDAGWGHLQHWDYNPPSEAAQQYVRNHMDWTVVAERFRVPPVG
jgi:choline-sulfatase